MRNKIPATSPYAAKMVSRCLTPAKGSELRTITATNLQGIGDGLTAMARSWSEVKIGDALLLRW
jgi:hypothetical protein